MPHARASVLAGLLLLAMAASGCLAGDSSSFGPGASGGTVSGTNAAGNVLPLAFSASPARGEAPLTVTFSLRAVGAANGVSWSVDFGDGSKPNAGGGLPDSVEHVYRIDGAFTVNFTVESPDGGTSVATLQVVVTPERDSDASSSTSSESSSASLTSASSSSSSTSSTTTTTQPTTPPTTTAQPTTTANTSTTPPTTTSESPTTTAEPTTTSTSDTTTTSSSSDSPSSTDTTTSDTSTTPPPTTSDTSTDTGTSTDTTTTGDPPA